MGKRLILKIMPKSKSTRKQKLKIIADLLKFAATTDDIELIKSIIESSIEMIEEIN